MDNKEAIEFLKAVNKMYFDLGETTKLNVSEGLIKSSRIITLIQSQQKEIDSLKAKIMKQIIKTAKATVEIERLEGENEKLRCCGNCLYTCELGKNYLPAVRCMGFDQWQPSPKSTE
jgi:hypothetical protein